MICRNFAKLKFQLKRVLIDCWAQLSQEAGISGRGDATMYARRGEIDQLTDEVTAAFRYYRRNFNG